LQKIDGDEVYTIHTLIDITNSGVITPKSDHIGFHQEQNLNTFLQIIGMRTQVLNYKIDIKKRTKLEKYNFGSLFNKTSTVWSLMFVPEATFPWNKEGNITELLYQDFNYMPIHTGLEEKSKFNPEQVDTYSPEYKNTCFQYHE
jgi:hypothetical protein